MKSKHSQRGPRKSESLTAIVFRKFLNFLGFTGLLTVLFGLTAGLANFNWPIVEWWATKVSSFLTILGALLTAASIYFWSDQPFPPERFSRYVSAPIVIVGAAGAIVYMCSGAELHIMIVNGFALMAIAGALLRMQPHTAE